jgi:hypothetical protein
VAGNRRKRKLGILVALCAALAAVCLPARAESRQAELRNPAPHGAAQFLPRGVDRRLLLGRGQVRVTIVIRGGSRIIEAALRRHTSLAPYPVAAERAALRHSPVSTSLAYARVQQRRRRAAINALDPAARAAAATQLPVQRAIVDAGGRIVTGTSLGNTVTAVVPRSSVARLAARADVQAIEPATTFKPLDTIASAASASGAPTWWAARHIGGRGLNDVPANLSVVQDPAFRAHPAFQGLTFETVPGEPTLPPSYSGNGHGTALVSMAAAQGPEGCDLCQPGDEQQKATAYGVSKVLDPDGAFSEFSWPLGVTYGRFDSDAHAWRYQDGASDPAQVLN